MKNSVYFLKRLRFEREVHRYVFLKNVIRYQIVGIPRFVS